METYIIKFKTGNTLQIATFKRKLNLIQDAHQGVSLVYVVGHVMFILLTVC